MYDKKRNFWDNFRFEFVLYINGNIICQRLFDVKNYNEDVLQSMEIKELMDVLTNINQGRIGIIPNYFKQLCKRVSWKNYNPYRVYESSGEMQNLFANEDVFTFEIKVDKRVVAKSQFSGNFFQTEVRYAVNIKEIIPEIIGEIEEYFSRNEYTVSYGDTPLKFKVDKYNFIIN